MVEWNNIGGFDRYPKITDELKEIDDSKTVIFLDDGKDVEAEILQKALIDKGQKNIKARDSIVFHVGCDGKDYEMWISATSYSNLRELKQIRDGNKNTLVDAKIKITRVSKDDMTISSFKFERA